MTPPDKKTPSPLLTQTLQYLRQCNQVNIQADWRWSLTAQSLDQALAGDSTPTISWDAAPLNERQHISWPSGRQVVWLFQRVTVPHQRQGYHLAGLTLRLALAWWAEMAEIYVNRELVQTGDLFDAFTRICLSPRVTVGQSFAIAIRLVSPGHDAGALVRSQLIYEIPPDCASPSPEPSFVADELEVLYHYAATLAPEKLADLEAALNHCQWPNAIEPENPQPSKPCNEDRVTPANMPLNQAFHQSLACLRQRLIPLSPWLKQRQVHCLGHAHLDLAWLWPVADTWQAAERTFNSVLTLQQDFPELTYAHSSPALFAWLEHHRPALFQRIQAQVHSGRWRIDAGLWVEPDLNLISGESIVRQILYGQRYCQAKFGSPSPIAWLPDTFGFCHQLPQLLKLGGIQVFATQKLRWNDTNPFPHELFTWQAPDGSQVLGWTLPPIGTDFDPIQIAQYAAHWEAKTTIPQAFWLPGVGDHGGGPSRDMLEKARRWAISPFFPEVKFGHTQEFLAEVKQASPSLPLWTDELYLELHRGCYTTHADQKQANRRCEDLLYQAEVWASIATLVTNQPYPQADLEKAWKNLLFNQFHDILPGTSIPQVFGEANQGWAEVEAIGTEIWQTSLAAILSEQNAPQPSAPAPESTNPKSDRHKPHPDAQQIFVFNSLNWPRTEVVSINLSANILDSSKQHWQIYTSEGELIPSQVHVSPSGSDHLSWLAEAIPSIGYRRYWLCPAVPRPSLRDSQTQSPPQPLSPTYCLQNQFLQVTIDATTGDILSLLDLIHQQEILADRGNQLQAFHDQGQYWDAWNIAPDYADHPLPSTTLITIDWITQGTLCQRLRVIRRLNQSTITQEYSLDNHSPHLTIETWIDWQETQVLLKVNFPLAIVAASATYEVPFGTISRPTLPKTSQDQAKWEVPALRWADLSDTQQGLSILTTCKHGFDATPSQLRLTLLKSPRWPDPNADRGEHHFTYALYPHQGSWQNARTVHQAHALNLPLTIYPKNLQEPLSTAMTAVSLPHSHSFLSLIPEHFILSALKLSESNPNQFILRCYDAYGQGGTPSVHTALGLSHPTSVDLLEEPLTAPANPADAYQITTYRLHQETTVSSAM